MTYLSEQIADGVLAAHMLSDAEGATTMVDSSGNGRNGTYTNVGLGAVSMIGSATGGEFNGIDTFGAVTSAAWMNVTNITVECVWRPYRNNTLMTMISRESGTSASRTFQFRVSSGGKLEFLFWDAAGTIRTVTGATTITRLTRTHVAATYDGSNAYVYLGGTQDGTLAVSSTLRIPAGAAPLEYGRVNTSGGAGQFFNGPLAGCGFYGTALSPTRIGVHAAAIGSGSLSYDGSGTWGLVA